jgi:hypothetical protein
LGSTVSSCAGEPSRSATRTWPVGLGARPGAALPGKSGGIDAVRSIFGFELRALLGERGGGIFRVAKSIRYPEKKRRKGPRCLPYAA